MSAARIPWAIWEPIANRSRLGNRPVRMTVHITAVRANDIYGPNKGPGATYAHAHNSRNGQFRQHQELTRMSQADLDGNGETVSIENEGREGDSLTEAQIDNLARVFAHCVLELGVPNRIATPDDTRGLAWHRLGVSGNFGAYKASDMTTWSAAQTGHRWTKARGKTCPTDKVIRQIPEIYHRAQGYINRGNPTPGEEPLVLTEEQLEQIAYAVWSYHNKDADTRDAYGILRATPKRVWLYRNEKVTDRDAYSHLLGVSNAVVKQIRAIVTDAVKGIPGVDGEALADQIADRVVQIEATDVADEVADRLTITTKEN